jgi:Family of unknown function (DUF6526)
MSAQPQQSYANHAQMVPGFHYVTGGLTILFLLTSIWRAMTARTIDAHIMMLGAFALLGTYWYARAFPLKAQDRVIRLEEQLRLTQLLPTDMQSRIGELSARQLIAMRFASDAELPELARWVLTEKVTDGKLIKVRIKTWLD